MVGAFIVLAAVVVALLVVVLALLGRRQLTWNRNQFTVEESELVNMMQSRHVSLMLIFATTSIALGIASCSSYIVGLEYLFTVACFVQALHLVYYGYCKGEMALQLRKGTWDPWTDVHGKRYAEAAAGSKAAAPRKDVPMVHLPASPLAVPLSPNPNANIASPVGVPLRPHFQGDAGSGRATLEENPSYLSVPGGSTPPMHPSEVKMRRPRSNPSSSNAIGGFSSFAIDETLPDFEEAAAQQGEGGFDDLLFALRTGDVFASELPSFVGSAGEQAGGADTFDMRRVSIADTHL